MEERHLPTVQMVRIQNILYEYAETGEWLPVGEYVMGMDGEYIQWYA